MKFSKKGIIISAVSVLLVAALVITMIINGDDGKMTENTASNNNSSQTKEENIISLSVNDNSIFVPFVEGTDALIDVQPYPGFSYEGVWQKDDAFKGPMKAAQYSLKISKGTVERNGKPSDAYCKYNPDLSVAGEVEIWVFLQYYRANFTDSMIYEVHHGGELDRFSVDLTEVSTSGWLKLGRFDFSGKEELNYVKAVCSDADNFGSGTVFCAATVRFDILNNAASGGIWQTIYITPGEWGTTEKTVNMDAFSDISDNSVYKYDIEYMYNEGIVTGTSDGKFSPNALIKRSDFLDWIKRLIGKDAEKLITKGVVFGSSDTITKETAAVMLYNAIPTLGRNTDWLKNFSATYKKGEENAVSAWAKIAVDTLYGCGVVTDTDGGLSPAEKLTRAEAAVMLKEFAQQFAWANPIEDTPDDGWVLTFSDEFSGNTLNTKYWTAMEENPGHILSSRHPENVVVKDGAVHLITKYESRAEGKNWTSGNILANTGAFTQEYGYWEARYKFCAADGINNSFWIMSTGRSDKTWYEIDINEGHYKNEVNTNLHEFVTSGKRTTHGEKHDMPYDLSADYHTYGLRWTPELLEFYFDGKLIRTMANVTSGGHQSFPRLSSAVLSWAGTITEKANGTAQVIDYVRVWQRDSDLAEHTTIK